MGPYVVFQHECGRYPSLEIRPTHPHLQLGLTILFMHVFPSRNLMIICPTLNRFPDIFAFFLKTENPNLHLGLVLGGKGTRPYHFSTPSGAGCVTVPDCVKTHRVPRDGPPA